MVTIWKRCLSCGTKWYFDETHQAQDVDLDACSWCGGELEPVPRSDEQPHAEDAELPD